MKSGGNVLEPLGDRFFDRDAFVLGERRHRRAVPVGEEEAGEKVVDRDVVLHGLPGEPGDEAREAGPRAVR
jgi:hypothetical protein